MSLYIVTGRSISNIALHLHLSFFRSGRLFSVIRTWFLSLFNKVLNDVITLLSNVHLYLPNSRMQLLNILWQFSKISYAFSNGVNVPYLVLITSFFMTFYFNVDFVGLSYFGIFIPVCVQLIYSYIINCKLTSLPRTLPWYMISYSLNIFLVFTQLDFFLLTAAVAIPPLRVNKLIQ